MQKQHFNEQGQSMVEIALLLPILLILFLGIAEVGFFLFTHVQVAGAARAGTRDGTLCKLEIDGNDCTNLNAIVTSGVYAEAPALHMNGGNTTISVTAPIMEAGEPITVTVTYNHTPPFISSFVPMFPTQIPVKHTVIMNFSN